MLEDRLKDAKGILHPDLTAKLKQKGLTYGTVVNCIVFGHC